jgi:hypothetical protein
MRAWALLIPIFAVVGSGCSSSSHPSSPVGPSGMPGDNGDGGVGGGGGDRDSGVDAGAGGSDGGQGGNDGGGGSGGGDMAPRDPAGPWPLDDLVIYNAAHGLGADGESIIDANSDDGQNIWAASHDSLYIMKPGDASFTRFTVADGLTIVPFTDAYDNSTSSFITAIAGGAAGQVYVGYNGYETTGDPYRDPENIKQLGNGDDFRLGSDGHLQKTRLLFRCDAERGAGCWENRSPRRIQYVHSGVAAGHSFWGFNHGVSHVLGDDFGDHVHPEIWYAPSTPGGQPTEKLGEFYGIATDSAGNCWMAGRYGIGLQPWNPRPNGGPLSETNTNDQWVSGRFIHAFTVDTADHSVGEPAGPFVTPGYREDNWGAAVGPGHVLWLARTGAFGADGGLMSWDPRTQGFQSWPQAPRDLSDIQADPDGTLWLVSGKALYRFDPASGSLQGFPGVSGVTRIWIDTTVTPRALYVSMDSGVAVIRAK